MTTYIALLRGINVGKIKRIRMEPLRNLVSDLGFNNVRTLVNSGNVVFDGDGEPDDIARAIEAALKDQHGLDVPVVVRTEAEMQAVVANNPFPAVAPTPKLLHVWFLATKPDAVLRAFLAELETGDDAVVMGDRELYLHAPNGLSGASPAIQVLDRRLPHGSTSRNWNTVVRLTEMAAT